MTLYTMSESTVSRRTLEVAAFESWLKFILVQDVRTFRSRRETRQTRMYLRPIRTKLLGAFTGFSPLLCNAGRHDVVRHAVLDVKSPINHRHDFIFYCFGRVSIREKDAIHFPRPDVEIVELY